MVYLKYYAGCNKDRTLCIRPASGLSLLTGLMARAEQGTDQEILVRSSRLGELVIRGFVSDSREKPPLVNCSNQQL